MRRSAIALACIALAVVATVWLGFWQLRRATGKEQLQAQMDAAARGPARAPDAATLGDPRALVFHHWALRGRWRSDEAVYLDNRPHDGQAGFYVLMPLRLEGPAAIDVIVNRGWTPRDAQERTRIAPYSTQPGVVEVSGVALADEPRLLELGSPVDRRLGTIWQNFDFAAFARVAGSTPAAMVLREDAGSGDPGDGLARDWPDVGGALQGQIDRHHGYAFQWFALAAALAAGLLYRFFRQVQHGRIVTS